MSTLVGRSAALIATALAASLGAHIVPTMHSERPREEQPLRSLRFLDMGGGMFWGRHSYRSGPGWTFAQVKRMARKAKNRKRHKAACRRAA